MVVCVPYDAYHILVVDVKSEPKCSRVEHLTWHERVDERCLGVTFHVLVVVLCSELE